MTDDRDITELLKRGDASSLEQLFPIVYGELREIAGALFRREYRANHTLQPTALIHETYLKLVGDEARSGEISWQSRAHFFGAAARAMRQILVNHAEARRADKRGGGRTIIALDEALSFFRAENIELLALDEALENLARLDERQANIVELKFFGGLKTEEIAEITKLSPQTIKREWALARAWLFRALN